MIPRQTHTAQFKFKVAFEALQENVTVAQLVSKYGVAASLIHKWKKQLIEEGHSIFGKKKITISKQEHPAELQRMIGQLQMENHFLAKVHANNKR